MKKRNKRIDKCPICSKNLYINRTYTMRIGIINTRVENELLGWICPYCKTEFDIDNKVNNFYGKGFIKGEA